jgi:hypothetical protein
MEEVLAMGNYTGGEKKADNLARLRRIEGQVRGLQRMARPTPTASTC